MEKLVNKAAARRIVPANRDEAINSKRKEMEVSQQLTSFAIRASHVVLQLLPSLSWPETFVMIQPAVAEDLDANDDFAREDAL